MSTLKKVLALTLALAMILSVSAFAGSYKADTYKDAASIDKDCEDSIELLYALDIMQGDAQGNFRPNDTITRAEVAKMIYVIKNYGKDDKAVTYQDAKIFSDVSATAWYAGYVNYCGVTKLIQGRGNGTFGPTDPVTTAAAAKMLLTAIGYDAEARGYVGANWDKNVLSDAAIVGLLDDYNYTTIGNAPRQWVAVMFANALLNAYTYKTMVAVPTNGLLNAGYVQGDNNIVKFGVKYYDLYDEEVYAYATENAYIDQYKATGKAATTYADKNRVLFSDGSQFKNTGLGYMDLGQKYRVIARDNAALSVRPIKSVVAEASVAEITYAFSYDKGDSTRKFTVGDMTAAFDAKEINALGNQPKDKGVFYGAFGEKNLIDKLDKLCNDMVKVIDKDGDGDIDYIILTYSDYAYVKKAGTDKSGDYVILQQKNANTGKYENIKATQSGKQWLGGEVESSDELVANNYVKRTWNVDNGSYDLEVLPVVHDVKYTAKEGIKEPVYTIGDAEYQLATKGFTTNSEMPSRNTKVSVVYDGGLAVYVGKYVFTYTDIEDIYKQLAVFTESFSMNSSAKPNRNVTGVAYYNMVPELIEEEYAGKTAELGTNDAHAYHLFASETDEDGAYLTYLAGKDTIADVRAALSADEDLIGDFKAGKGTLNGKKDSFAFGQAEANKFGSDAKFFVISKSGSKVVVEVKTIDEIEEKVFENVYAELLYSPADSKGNVTIVGGLLDMRTRTYGTSTDNFFILEKDNKVAKVEHETKDAQGNVTETSYTYELDVRVMFSDKTKDDVTLTFDTAEKAQQAMNSLKLYALYGYTYNGDTEVYTLGELKEKASFDFDEEHFTDPKGQEGVAEIAKDRLSTFNQVILDNDIALNCDEDTVIALTIKHYSNDNKHELMNVEHFFTDVAHWDEVLGIYSIVNGTEVTSGEVESFTCYSDVAYYDHGALLNICIYADDLWQ